MLSLHSCIIHSCVLGNYNTIVTLARVVVVVVVVVLVRHPQLVTARARSLLPGTGVGGGCAAAMGKKPRPDRCHPPRIVPAGLSPPTGPAYNIGRYSRARGRRRHNDIGQRAVSSTGSRAATVSQRHTSALTHGAHYWLIIIIIIIIIVQPGRIVCVWYCCRAGTTHARAR